MSARLEYTSEHRQFREMVHDFVQQTVVPAHEQWEKAGCLDRSLFTEAGKLGLLAFSVPEEFGGPGVDDFRYNAIVVDELQRAGAAAEAIALSLQNDIVLPYLTDLTTAEQQRRWLPGVVAGETVIGIAMTEPGAGSDLAGIRATAVRDGDHYAEEGAQGVAAAGGRAGNTGLQPRPEPGEDRSARPGHQRAQLHRHAGSNREPTRGRRPGLLSTDEQPAPGTAVAGRRRGGGGRGCDGRNPRLRQAAKRIRLPHLRLAEHSIRARRTVDRNRCRAYLSRRLHRRTPQWRVDRGPGRAAEMVDHRTSGSHRPPLLTTARRLRVHAGISGLACFRRRSHSDDLRRDHRDHEDDYRQGSWDLKSLRRFPGSSTSR